MDDNEEQELEQLSRLVRDLLNRVERLERRVGIEAQSTRPQAPPVDSNVIPILRPAAAPKPGRTAPTAGALVSRLGSQWLSRVGIVALLFGVSFFLTYAVENRWIGPTGRVSAGLLFGIAIMVWSEWFRARDYRVFSFSLKAVATGVLYLSLWAAFQLYGLVPFSMAFPAMLLVTGITAAFAFWQHAEVLALVALIGGFATPLLLSTAQNRAVELFAYLAVLDCATLLLVAVRQWPRLLLANLIGTAFLNFTWYATYYESRQLGLSTTFTAIFFLIFAIGPLLTSWFTGKSAPALLYVVLVNAGLFFAQIFLLFQPRNHTATAYWALGLAGFYSALAWRATPPARNARLGDSHVALAGAFAAIAIALRFSSHWISIGWFLLAAVLILVGFAYAASLLRWLGLALLAAAALKVFAYDIWRLERGYRIVSFVCLGVLLLVISFLYQRDWLPLSGLGESLSRINDRKRINQR